MGESGGCIGVLDGAGIEELSGAPQYGRNPLCSSSASCISQRAAAVWRAEALRRQAVYLVGPLLILHLKNRKKLLPKIEGLSLLLFQLSNLSVNVS